MSSTLLPRAPSLSKDFPFPPLPVPLPLPLSPSLPRTPPLSPSVPLSSRLSRDLPLSLPLSPTLSDTTRSLEGLSLSRSHQEGFTPLRALANPPAKRKLLSRSHRGQYFSGPQRWLRGQSGESHIGSLSEGVYTKQLDLDLQQTPTGDQPQPTYVSHASCVLESRKGRHREPRPHVRKIFVEPCKRASLGQAGRSWDEEEEEEEHAAKMKMTGEVKAAGVSVVVDQEEEPVGTSTQEVDSDDQTNAQVSEILSSTL